MAFWDSVKSTLKKIVPSGLGFLINAVAPGTGGIATSIIANVLGCEDEPEAMTRALENATPDQIAALKTEANRHEEALINLSLESDRLEFQADHDEKESARQRETAIVQATGKKDWNLYALAWTIVVGFFGMVYTMMTQTIPPQAIGPVNQLFGFLGAAFTGVVGYFFGSSKSSSDKTKLLGMKK